MENSRAYSWHETLEVEREGALILDGIFGREYIIVPARKEHQRAKVDRFFIHKNKVLVHIVDYKVERRGCETGNIAYEYISVEIDGKVIKPGWVFASPADLFIHYLPTKDIAYVVRSQAVRDRWEDIRARFDPKMTTTNAGDNGAWPHESYITRFIPIPILWLIEQKIVMKSYSAIGSQLRLDLKTTFKRDGSFPIRHNFP